MKRFGLIILSLGCFALGTVVQRFYDVYGLTGLQVRVQAPGETTDASTPQIASVDFAHQPLWAYGFEKRPAPGEKASPQALPSRALRPNQDPDEQTRPRNLEGSTATYSLIDIRDLQNVVDWYPGDHPPMPDIVKHGPARAGKAKRGCGSCHLPNGLGRPENAAPAGLPKEYAVRQLRDFQSGRRYSADPRKPNTNTMIDMAKAMTDEEIGIAANYFSALPWKTRVRVVETAFVPTTRIVGNLFLPTAETRTDPIAGRIIEVPENEEQTETLRNPRVGFIAYVPVGSLARGEHLVRLGGAKIVNDQIIQGKTTACTACHGENLLGVADVPPIAGRSPSYIARQLFDIQQGTRNGPAVQLMKLVVARLTSEDMVDIAAYVGSQYPPSSTPAPSLLSRR